jgi:hypothetical protein
LRLVHISQLLHTGLVMSSPAILAGRFTSNTEPDRNLNPRNSFRKRLPSIYPTI